MSERGPIHYLDEGDYRAVIRAGVPMIERVSTVGAVRMIEWETPEQERAWREAIIQDEQERQAQRDRPATPAPEQRSA